MRKISIHGFYGMGNLGDEAILQALLQEMRLFSDIQVVVFSRASQQVTTFHGVKSVPTTPGKRSDLRRLWHIKTSNLFILGGGGLLKDYGANSSSLQHWLKFLRMAQKLRIKTALWAIGVENIRYKASIAGLKEILKHVDFISVRDRLSQEMLQTMGIEHDVHLYTDPAVLLMTPQKRESSEYLRHPKIMICIRHWFEKGQYIEKSDVNQRMLQSIAIAADSLVKQYSAKIDFIPLRTVPYDDDRVVADQVISYMKYTDNVSSYASSPNVHEFVNLMPHYSCVIGMRLHALILATAAGIPVIGLEYMPKVRAYLESLQQSEYLVNLDTITDDTLITLIEKTFEHYDDRSQRICAEISRLQTLAHKNITDLLTIARQ